MSGLVGRFVAWIWRFGIGARVLLMLMMVWSTVVMDDYRVPGGSLLSVLNEGRVPLMVVAMLLLAHSFSTLRVWTDLHRITRMLERFAPVVVLGAAVLGTLFSGRLLVIAFVGAGVVITEILLLRLVEHLTAGDSGHADAARRVKMIVFWVFGAYLASCFIFSYNAMLDTSRVTTYRSEAIGSSRRSLKVGVFSYEVWWLHLQSWRHPGRTEQIILHPWRDGYWFTDAWAGMPLLVNVRAGMLGMPWVDTAPIDRVTLLERVVSELPTATVPRKELIAAHVAGARWDAALRHAREYQVLYPEDLGYIDGVMRSIPGK